MAEKQRILFVQTAFLGDLVLSVPTLKHLKKIYPQCEISLVARSGIASFLLKLGLIDYLYEIEKSNSDSYKKLQQEFIKTKWDLIVCPHQSLRTALFVHAISATQKISYKSFWNKLFFNLRVTKKINHHDVLRQLSLLSFLDPDLKSKLAAVENNEMPEWASLDSKKHIQAIQTKNITGKTICFFPGSVWATKQWSETGFIELGKDLTQQGYKILLMGAQPEQAICEKIAQQVPNSENLAGKTSVADTLQILSEVSLCVSNDSAGQHLAALAGCASVTIYGSTTPAQGFYPWNKKALIIEKKNMRCRPCGPHGHPSCPLGNHKCMQDITAGQVLAGINQLGLLR